ncbi:MAG: hypothetical protein H6591_10480 [Flavobacteriales bacterium]|nr:hypothetical protein [Flavobacteriales bacterium]
MDRTDEEAIAKLGRASVHFHVYLADPKSGKEVGRAQVSAGESFTNGIVWSVNGKSNDSYRGIKDLVVGMKKLSNALNKSKVVPMEKYVIDVHGKPKELSKAEAQKIVLGLWKKYYATTIWPAGAI